MHSDEIIETVGGMSRFQFLLIPCILLPKIAIAWGMLMMSFAAVAPEMWWCLNVVTDNVNAVPDNATSKHCPSNGNNRSCEFVYSEERDTVINEWNLICDKKHVAPTITAVQMGGVLIGCLIAGHVSEAIGRKKTFFVSFLLHAGFNLVAAFSVSWQMFMAMRFCIGTMIGSVLSVYYPYFMEFVGPYWRPITSTIPIWSGGAGLFAFVTWLRPRWSDLHIILAAMHVPFFLGWFLVPESLRWLTVHGRLEEAEKVVDQMARYNRTKKPVNTVVTLQKIAEEERKARDSGTIYSYIDIYRGWKMCLRSFSFQITWFFVSFVYYGLSFGVGYLTGNLYLNIFLINMLDIPGVLLAFFLVNRIGRRWTGFLFFSLAATGAFTVAVLSRTVSSVDIRGPATTAFALFCKMSIEPAWNTLQLMTAENYPTAIRNLGYSAANVAARLGGIISPYAFVVGSKDDLCPPFLIVGSVLVINALLTLTFRETHRVPLEDTTMSLKGKSSEIEANGTEDDSSNCLKEDAILGTYKLTEGHDCLNQEI